MGAGWAKPALVEPFTTFQAWDHGKASEVVCVFKDNEFDFGVDVDIVAALLEGDRQTAEKVVKKLAPDDRGVINGLAFLGVLAFFSRAPDRGDALRAKVGLAFDAFDLEDTNDLSRDEFTIALLSCLRALTVALGRGVPPTDSDCEQIVNKAYTDRGKDYSTSVSKHEFFDFVAASVEGCAGFEDVLIGFGVSGLASTTTPSGVEAAPELFASPVKD